MQPTSTSKIPNRVLDTPPPIELDDSDEWEVNWVLDSKFNHQHKGPRMLYLVKWKVLTTPLMQLAGNHQNTSPMHLTWYKHSIRHIQTSQFPKSLGREQ